MSKGRVTNLLDLPNEILDSIFDALYEPWDLQIRIIDVVTWDLRISGYPPRSYLSTCKVLSQMARKAESRSFSGALRIREEVAEFGYVCEAFVKHMQDFKYFQWFQDRINVIKFSNPVVPPAVWRFAQTPYYSYFPNVRRIELDCRWVAFYANHNVPSAADFFSGADGRLIKLLDYRLAFFLSCEKFLFRTLRAGVAITVIREMGVREMTDRCQAVVSILDKLDTCLLTLYNRSHRSIMSTKPGSWFWIGRVCDTSLLLSSAGLKTLGLHLPHWNFESDFSAFL